MMIVFEPELWGVSPLIPDGKTPTYKPASTSGNGTTASAKPGETSKGGLKLWDGGSFDFHDILDVINPLQHLPIVNAIYRSEVKDEIGAVPRILGSMLYGGGVIGALIGAASAVVDIVVEAETGKDLGQHIYTAIFGEGAGTRRTTNVAASKAGTSGVTGTSAAKTTEAKPAEAKSAVATKPGETAPAATGKTASPGAKKISSKADAALQAFVAGLAKSASPAAAAAANAAITKRAFRVTSSAAAGANGKNSKGTPAKGNVSTQFRRADWYQHNQAILKAQAAALAKKNAAAAKARTSGGDDGKSAAAILHLFTHPNVALRKPASTAKSKAAPAAPPAKPAAKSTSGTPAGARRGAAAGPWVVNEIASGLAKYEALVKARKAEAAGK